MCTFRVDDGGRAGCRRKGMVRTSPETGHVLEVDTVDIPDLFTHCFIVSCDQPLWQVSARHDKGDTESRESGDGHGERASE